LAAKVTEGRRTEFARFERFNSQQGQAQIPDPTAENTFLDSKLDWDSITQEPHCNWLEFYQNVLQCRREKVVPRIKDIAPGRAKFEVLGSLGLDVQWPFAKSGSLQLIANFDRNPLALRRKLKGELLYSTSEAQDGEWKDIPAITAAWFLNA
jgi:maltooligosyltrehalose trehalohydrolase